MSKESDNELEPPVGEEPTRRRRRKSGLRVPSDNVPRQPQGSTSATAPPTDQQPALQGAAAAATLPTDPQPALSAESDRDADPNAEANASQNPAKLPWTAESPGTIDMPGAADRDASSASIDHADDPASQPPDGEVAPLAIAASAHEAPKTVRMEAFQFPLDDVDGDAIPGPASTEDSVDIPIEVDDPDPVAQDSGRHHSRATTVALSDDDLEELLESSDLLEDMRAGNNNQTAPADSGDEPSADDSDSEAPPADVATSEVDTAAADDRDSHAADTAAEPTSNDLDEPAPTPATTDPAASDDAPQSAADNSDSGEILEDDLLEEVDEVDEVDEIGEIDEFGAVGHAEEPPPPPPTPIKSATKPGAHKLPPPAPKGHEPALPPRPRRNKRWFEEIFDEDYLRTLPFLTPQATQSEALFVAEALSAEPGARLLDVGCGYGRHAMELAARGFQIIALDSSLPLLLRGADEAQRRGLGINFVHGDMRELAFDSQFDGAYCLFSTFGYFDDETNRQTIAGIARALKPGSRLVLEVLNRDYLIAGLPTRVWWEGDGCVVLEEVDFNYFNSRIVSNRSVVFDDGRQTEQEISIRSYSLHEVGQLLQAVGLKVLEVSGSMATRGRFFGIQSREVIVVAEKRVRSEPVHSSMAADGSGPIAVDTDTE